MGYKAPMFNNNPSISTLLVLSTLAALPVSASPGLGQKPTPQASHSASPTPRIASMYNGSIGLRYDRLDSSANPFHRLQDSVVLGFTITPNGLVDLVGMIQTGAPYGKKWNTAVNFDDPSKNSLETTLYFKQIYLQKSFRAFGLPVTGQAGILGTNQKVGTQSLVGPVTAIGTNGWSEGARVTLQTHLGDFSATGGSITDMNQSDISKRNRELNYVEVQLSRKVFDALTIEASGGKYDGQAFFRGAAEYDLTLVSEHLIRLFQEAFYSQNQLNYATGLTTDLGKIFNEKLAGRVNLDLRYSYISPDSNLRGQMMNDLVINGHVLTTALYGKVDKQGRLNWFAAKDFLDVKRIQTGLVWKFSGSVKKEP